MGIGREQQVVSPGSAVRERLVVEEHSAALADVVFAFAESTTDLGRLAQLVVQALVGAVGDVCQVDTVSNDGAELTFRAAGFRPELIQLTSVSEAEVEQRFSVTDSVSYRAALDGRVSFLAEASSDEFLALQRSARQTVRALVLPLRCRGAVVGVASLLRLGSAAPFCDGDLDAVRPLAEHAGLALGNALALESARNAQIAAQKAAQSGAEAGARFAKISESGIIGIVVGDFNGRVLEANDALLHLLGYSRAEIVSGKVTGKDLTPPEWRHVDVRAISQLDGTGVAALREKEYVRKDGTRVPVLIGSARIDGETPRAISFVLDLTELKLAQAALEKLHAQHAADATFQALLQSAPDATVIVNGDGVITLVNDQLESLFGYAKSELVGQPIEMLVPDRYRDAHPGHRTRYNLERTVRPMGAGRELYGRRKGGDEFPIEVSLSPLQTEGGLLISSAIRDISERKRAEVQRASLAAIVESTDDAIIGKSLDGIVTSWNEGAHRLFGYSAREIVGRSISVLVPAERVSELAAVLHAVGQGGAVRQFDTVRRRKDGSTVDVSVTISPVRDTAGQIVGICKVARDVTDRRRAEAELARAKETAEAASRELEAFSYSVAHDLRAPLRAMNGFAQVLVNRYKDDFDARALDWLQEILLNSKRMGALIDSLLSLSRINRNALKRETVDLSALVRAVCVELTKRDPKRTVRFLIEEQLSADVDAVLGRALLENLLGNAWKFTSGVPEAVIEFGALLKDGERAFFVRDNGAGFDMAYASKLFGAFQRLHSAEEFPGTGIGLATVQRIVHRHGGRVWAEGEVGLGATFFFCFSNQEHAAK